VGVTYSFKGQLALRLWAPFKAEADGYRVNVTAGCSKDDLALEAIKRKSY
jgi:hypothetical protein